MTVTEILRSVQFLVDQEGKPTAAVLDMRAWRAFLAMLEDIEDQALIRERLKDWREKHGWTTWEDFDEELGADEIPGMD